MRPCQLAREVTLSGKVSANFAAGVRGAMAAVRLVDEDLSKHCKAFAASQGIASGELAERPISIRLIDGCG